MRLENVAPDSVSNVGGNEAKAWRYATLPAALQRRLIRRAEQLHYRGPEHLLSAPARLAAGRSLSQVAQPNQERAHKLRQTLSRARRFKTQPAPKSLTR